MPNLSEISTAIENITIEQIVQLIDQLIQVNTTVPPGNHYLEFIETVSPRLIALGFTLQTVIIPDEFIREVYHTVEGPRANLFAIKDFGQKKTITFYGHMDVVPAIDDEDAKWRSDPFRATLKGKRIFGRGVADMKGSIACLVLALEIIQKMEFTPKYNLRIVLCTDEELGGKPGVAYLAEQGYLKDTIFCLDGLIWDKYIVGAPGDLLVEIDVMGVSCHSGMNYLGTNAIDAIVPILDEFIVLRKIVEARRSAVPGIPRPETPNQRNLGPMFNLSIIQAGIKNNIVPGTCHLTIDRRTIPEENIKDIKQEIMDAVNRGKSKSIAKDVKVEFHGLFPPLKIDPNTPEALRMQKVIHIVNKLKSDTLQPLSLPGSTDMGFVNEILKTDDIIFRGIASTSSNPHGVNENVSLGDAYILIKEIVLFLCGDL